MQRRQRTPRNASPHPTAIPTIVPVVMAPTGAPPSPGSTSLVSGSVILIAEEVKMGPLRPITSPSSGRCLQPALRAIKTGG